MRLSPNETTGEPSLSRTMRLLVAAGQGALAGWVAGVFYGGWGVFLGEDLGHGLVRLACERLGSASLAGASIGALASLIALFLMEAARRRGTSAAVLAATTLAGSYLTLAYLAAFPGRETYFQLHIHSTKILSLSIFAGMGLSFGLLLAWRIAEAVVVRGSGRAVTRGIGAAGILLAAVSGVSQLAVPRLPLPAGATGRSIILVSLDTMRGDRLGALGYHRPLTPRLDALARAGALFEQASAAAPWTLPSHASLFTGRLPYSHGARTEHRAVRPDLVTLAERLGNAGYRTAAFTGGGYVASYFGFAQGFEIYEDHDETREGGSQEITRSALEWIRGVRDEPFFAFIHTYEVHYPYVHSEFVDSGSREFPGGFGLQELEAVHRGERVLTPEERESVTRLYDGDVAAVDRNIGGMLERLAEEGILDAAVVVILSDHGEDLWDHDATRSPGHGHSLYEEILRVPLIFRAPGLVQAGARIRTPVSLIDVAPTLLDLLGLPGFSEAEGRSLAGALKSGGEPEALPVIAESIEYGPDRFSRRDGNLKVIIAPAPDLHNSGVKISARPIEMFELSQDPGELNSLAGAPPPGAAPVVEELWQRVERVFRPARQGDRRISPELREQLRSLGYVK